MLLNLPGFGPTKVRRLHEAFQKPFYPNKQKNAYDAFSAMASTITEADELAFVEEEMARAQAAVASSSKVRVEDLEMGNIGAPLLSGQEPTVESRSSAPAERPRRPRSPSPVWDIELDLNDSPPPGIEESIELNNAVPARGDNRPSKKLKVVHTLEDSDSISSFGD